jgi:hypothetical protein
VLVWLLVYAVAVALHYPNGLRCFVDEGKGLADFRRGDALEIMQ